jgi:two-component system, LuxR family, response regulator FixJ
MTTRHLYIVDDDKSVRASLRSLMETQAGLHVQEFASGDDFLAAAADLAPGCVLLDLNMPGTDGIATLEALARYPARYVAIILTGQGEIADAVQAMKAGAADFLEKPCDHRALIKAVNAAFIRLTQEGRDNARRDAARSKLDLLSARELEVLQGLIEGLSNKLIAHQLQISPRTVEIYRSKLMEKLEVRSVSEALRIGFAAGIIPEK